MPINRHSVCALLLLGQLAMPMAVRADAPCAAAVSFRLREMNEAARSGHPLEPFADPGLPEAKRRELFAFYDPPYRRFEVLAKPQNIDCIGREAISPIEVGWSTETTTFHGAATVWWVNRNGEWYITKLSGFSFPWVAFTLLMAGALVYVAAGLAQFFHARRRRAGTPWMILSFVPPIWPIYWIRKPWLKRDAHAPPMA